MRVSATWVLDALRAQLGISPVMRKLLKGRRLDDSAERVLSGLVATVRMTIAFDAPCTARRTSCSGSCSVLGQVGGRQ